MSLRLKLSERLDAAKSLREKMQATLSTAEAASRAMTTDERTAFTELETQHTAAMGECEGLKADIQRSEKLAKQAGDKSFEDFLPPPGIGRKTKPGAIENPKLSAEEDPCRGFRGHNGQREFLRAVMLAKHPEGPRHLDDRGRMVSGVDERLNTLRSQSLTAGSDEANTISGEWFIPPAFHPDLLMIEPMFPAMAVTDVPMESPKVDIPARVDKDHTTSVTGGLTVTRRPEATQMSASRMKTEPISLVAAGQYGLAYVTEELLNDSPLSIAAIIEKGFNTEFQAATVRERLYGSGTGEFLGVMNSPCLITVTGRSTGTIDYADVLNMVSRLWGSTRPGTCWLYSPSCLPQLAQLSVGDNKWPVWMPSAREGEPDRLLGFPAYRTEFCKALSTTGDIILGQWGEYLEGTYQQIQTAESIHVRFEWNERVYRFYRRNAGCPWWKTTMGPAEAGATYAAIVAAGHDLSPFVALNSA